MQKIQNKVSIIIPIYNEEKTIMDILESVNKQKIDSVEFEIIVVDDGSEDNSLKILHEHKNMYSKLIESKPNKGKGNAVRAGLKIATGDYVLFQDADLEYDPNDYSNLLLPIKKFNADLVIGSRLIAPPLVRVHYLWNRVGNQFITGIFNFLNNTTFTDIYTGYLLFKRELIDPNKLRTNGWEQQAEILSKIVKSSKMYYEVPISYYGRTYEEGKKIKPKHVLKIIITIIRERIFSSK